MFKQSFITLLAAFLLIPLFACSQTSEADTNTETEVIAVRMYADWCGKCKMLDAKVENIQEQFKDSNIMFLYFDQTDDFATIQSEKLAGLLGLDELFADYKGKTGMMLLVDANTRELIEEINHEIEESALVAKLKEQSS